MKLHIMGIRKSVDKKGNVIEVMSTVPARVHNNKCKEQDCKFERANGSSRCPAHNKNAKISKDFAIPKELNAKQ